MKVPGGALAALLVLSASDAATQEVRYFRAALPSPDGRAVAYSLYDGRITNYEPASLQVLFVDSREEVVLPGVVQVLATPLGERRPLSWSPNGQKLAYVARENSSPVLMVWNREERTVRRAPGVVPCSLLRLGGHGCYRNQLQWSSDGNTVFFLGQAATELAADQRPAASVSAAPSQESGVSVRTTNREQRERVVQRLGPAADVFAFNVSTQTTSRLTQNGRFGHLLISPSEQRLLAIAPSGESESGAKQAFQDYYVIQTAPHEFRSASDDRLNVRDQNGVLTPLARGVRQRAPLASWSPDERRIAFVEQGALTDGDVRLLHVESGQVTSATPHQLFGTVSDVDAAHQTRSYEYPGSKFGSQRQAPVWTADGRALLLLRFAREADMWRASLWRLDLSSHRAQRVWTHVGCDVLRSFPISNERVALISFCDGSRLSFTSLNVSGVERRARSTEIPAARPAVLETWGHANILFTREFSESPPELYVASAETGGTQALTAVNAPLPLRFRAEMVTWTERDGSQATGTLFLPRQRGGGPRPPMIVEIYPTSPDEGGSITYSTFRYPNPAITLLPPLPALLERGVAIFRPNISVAGGGRTCVELAESMNRALAATSRHQLVDNTRVGVIGFSFGGFAVNCLVTRLNTFRGAVSISGVSDLVSLHFARFGRDWAGGVDKCQSGRLSAKHHFCIGRNHRSLDWIRCKHRSC